MAATASYQASHCIPYFVTSVHDENFFEGKIPGVLCQECKKKKKPHQNLNQNKKLQARHQAPQSPYTLEELWMHLLAYVCIQLHRSDVSWLINILK